MSNDDFKPEYHVIAGKAKVIEEIKDAGQEQGQSSISRPTPTAKARRSRGISPSSSARSRHRPSRAAPRDYRSARSSDAIANPAELNHDLFDAQQARRVLDRLVGYQISPLLWDKVKRGISAGRVQSVALRIIVEREKEREAFRAEEYWTLDARSGGRQSAAVQGPPLQLHATSVSTTRPTSCPRPRRARLSPRASRSPSSSARSSARRSGAARRRRSSPRACSRRPRASSTSRPRAR